MEEQLRLRRLAAERHREQIRQQLERARAMAQRKPTLNPSLPPRQVQPPRQAPPTLQRQKIAPPRAAAVLQSPQQPQQPEQPQPPATITPPTSPQSPSRIVPNTTAVLLHRWLNPNTLRSQFILTEIFQPPLAFREPRA